MLGLSDPRGAESKTVPISAFHWWIDDEHVHVVDNVEACSHG